MKAHYAHRLLAVGPARELKKFERSDWEAQAHAKYLDVLECSKTRLAVQFETDELPLVWLRNVSKRWSRLVFFLDYEDEDRRIKGLAHAWRHQLDVLTTHY